MTDDSSRGTPTSKAGASRRDVLKSLAAAGVAAAATALCSTTDSLAQTASATTRKGLIDVHHHMTPSFYMSLRRAEQRGDNRRDPANVRNWTPAVSLEQMDKFGIATAMISLAVSGVSFNQGDDAAVTLARKSNEFGAQMMKDHPGRFGLFAALPLPNQDASLREIEYAYDTLKADGIALVTDYGDKWPGDPAYVPAFEELNRRKAVVFVHPTTADCCSSLIPGTAPSWEEYPFDTARAITSLLVNNTFTRFPDIRFIFCHSGGAMPMLANRIAGFFPPSRHQEVLDQVKKLYFDVANASSPAPLAALRELVPTSQILFGTDFPFIAPPVTIDGLEHAALPANVAQAIDRKNSLRLFPRLAA